MTSEDARKPSGGENNGYDNRVLSARRKMRGIMKSTEPRNTKMDSLCIQSTCICEVCGVYATYELIVGSFFSALPLSLSLSSTSSSFSSLLSGSFSP